MAEGTTAVDFITLAEFQQRVEKHLNTAGELLASMVTDVGTGPELGEFEDAVNTNLAYWDRWAVQYNRINRLASALSAANEATRSILEKYKTTEELNQAKLSDLAAQFAGLSIVTEGLVVDGI
jgi:predicted MarR family transcription regulator